jgi:poly(3-hydroxybutyrate) depolymerase
MFKHTLVGLSLASCVAVHAQTIHVRGKISNQAGQAVAGAIVELSGRKLKDTTASDGMFSIKDPSTGVRWGTSPLAGRIALDGNTLELALSGSHDVKIEVFDVKGNLLRREAMAQAAAGDYRWNLSGKTASDNLMIIKASIDGQTQTFRHLPSFGNGHAARRTASDQETMAARLAKAAAVIDTLNVTASGFAPKSLQISGYDSMVNVTLDPSGDGGLKNPPQKSSGCGKATTMTNGKKAISSGGRQRDYILDIPAGYDMNKPYRLFYISHWVNGTAEQMQNNNYYALKPTANAANDPAIFVAPQGIGGFWGEVDHALFDNLVAHLESNLCVDVTRIFATGFSFGGMITYSLSTVKQKKIRAAVGMGPANYNIWIPGTKLKDPIPWMQTTGMSDGTTPWVNSDAQKRGSKYIALEKAADNGCKIPEGNNIPVWKSGAHVCYDFQGCKAGFPVKVCTFNGAHTEINRDPGSNVNWVPQESWKFFTQF